ncbi:hypothetical protein OEZ85_013956 [Tetradesmus obliquus]|uniref:5'-nucleotidase n=1 Tax=Tetradesmus obliquus TaxID=3088 RepID=A0ABY8U6G7_TETOB|nr:hypothetical protein OEZ85_013956 [Tetradesmus obliquus]
MRLLQTQLHSRLARPSVCSQQLRASLRVCCSVSSSGNGSSSIGSNSSSSSSSSSSSVSTAATATAATTTQRSAKQAIDYGVIPAPPSSRQAIWTEQVWGASPSLSRQIFCNRSLNMKQIKAIGFDMDYTLAQYKPDTFELLAHSQTVDKLVTAFGYPPELYDFKFDWRYMMRGLIIDKFDWRYMMRGLIIDKTRGNVIKVDRHKYVKVAYHGFRSLSSEERNAVYNHSAVRDDYEEPAYGMIDTLFSLAEAYLFMQLVELVDKAPGKLPNFSGYAGVYRDVRAAVDLCHRDGSLKRHVAANPSKYIHDDPHLVSMLQMYKRSGRQLFLATNSLWDYTHVVMNYLCGKRVGKAKNDEWLRMFDVVVVGCGKPGFFSERRPLFAVSTRDGALHNTDNGAPIIPLGEEDLPDDILGRGSTMSQLDLGEDDKAAVFQGGNYVDLHQMLGVRAGSELLYVGDHIYGDILRSKKSLGWRTMLVVPELEQELAVAEATRTTQFELKMLRNARSDLDTQIQRLEWAFKQREIPPEALLQNQEQLALLRAEREAVKDRHSRLLLEHHQAFHPIWGQLLKTGYQNSRYGHQIDRFACLYTSHVANLAFYSPDRAYGGRVDYMAHEDVMGLEGMQN